MDGSNLAFSPTLEIVGKEATIVWAGGITATGGPTNLWSLGNVLVFRDKWTQTLGRQRRLEKDSINTKLRRPQNKIGEPRCGHLDLRNYAY